MFRPWFGGHGLLPPPSSPGRSVNQFVADLYVYIKCVYIAVDDEAHTEHLPKFHYEVHHVAHKFGHDTPADIKLRDVARHAAVASDDDDDDDDEETSPADAADQLQTPGRQRLAPVGATQLRSTDYEYKHPLVAPADYDPAVDKKRDEEVNYNSEPQLKQTDLRDSMDSYYGQYEGDVDEAENNIQGQAERRVDRADRDSSNSLPSPVSDVYFVGNVPSYYAEFGCKWWSEYWVVLFRQCNV